MIWLILVLLFLWVILILVIRCVMMRWVSIWGCFLLRWCRKIWWIFSIGLNFLVMRRRGNWGSWFSRIWLGCIKGRCCFGIWRLICLWGILGLWVIIKRCRRGDLGIFLEGWWDGKRIRKWEDWLGLCEWKWEGWMGLLWGCICVGSSDRFFLGGGVEVYVVGVYKVLILYKYVIKLW